MFATIDEEVRNKKTEVRSETAKVKGEMQQLQELVIKNKIVLITYDEVDGFYLSKVKDDHFGVDEFIPIDKIEVRNNDLADAIRNSFENCSLEK